MIATANAHELRLLQKRLEFLAMKISTDSEVDGAALRKFDPQTSDLFSLVFTLKRLLAFGDVGENEASEALLIEREILKARVARLLKLKNVPKPFYEYYEPEFDSL